MALALAGKGGLVPMLSNRIVGGSPTTIEAVPWIVSMQRYGSHRCGSSIISPTRLLTAAHCTVGITTSGLTIRAGSTNAVNGGQAVNVARINNHPRYSGSTLDNDIAVLWISALNTGSGIRPIRLPNQNEGVGIGVAAHVSGWGALCENCAGSNTLRYVHVNTISNADCNRLYKGGILAGMLCAGFPEGKRDACQGDSGGPLVIDNTLVGVVSWGEGCARPGLPGVYTRVALQRSWVNSVL